MTRQKHFVTWLHCKSDGPADCDVWLLIYQLVLLLYAVRSRVRLIFEFQAWRSNLSTTLISALHLQNEVIKKCQWQCCWKASLSYAAGIAHLQTYNLKKATDWWSKRKWEITTEKPNIIRKIQNWIIKFKSGFFYYLKYFIILIKPTDLYKALTKYKRPKMKRDSRQKCSIFLILAGISFHFRPLFGFC